MTSKEESGPKAPSSGKVKWQAKPNGLYYDFELHPNVGVVKKRAGRGIIVKAQTHYYALKEAARELLLAPEHINLEEQDEIDE